MNRTKNVRNLVKAGAAAFVLAVRLSGVAQETAEQTVVQTNESPAPAVAVTEELQAPGYTAPFETFEFQQVQSSEQKQAEQGTVWHRMLASLAMYVPNVLLDLADCVSIELGAGAVANANVFVTRAFGLGAGYGSWEALGWTYNRQYGAFQQQGWQEHFLFTGSADLLRYDTSGTMKPFWIEVKGFSVPYEQIYADRIRDYFGIGFDVGLVWSLSVTLHPSGIVDFVAGLFFADPGHDNLKLEPVVPPPVAVPTAP